MNGRETGNVVAQIECNPVEHNHGQHFVDAPFVLQETNDNAPDSTGNRSSQETKGNEHDTGQISQQNAHHAGRHRAHHELTLCADVKHARPERERHRQTHHNVRRCVHNGIRQTLRSGEHAPEQRSVSVRHRNSHHRQENCAHNKCNQNGQNCVGQFIVRKGLQKAFFLIHSAFLLPS